MSGNLRIDAPGQGDPGGSGHLDYRRLLALRKKVL